MKPWPKHPRDIYPAQLNVYSDTWKAALQDYERARADAAIAKLRVAVAFIAEAHEEHCESVMGPPGPFPCNCRRGDVLAQIGELPEG